MARSTSSLLLLFLGVLFVFAVSTLQASSTDFLHLQTDRPSYRLGDTVWYRVHSRTRKKVHVRFLDASGRAFAEKTFANAGVDDPAAARPKPISGRFLVPERIDGGQFRIVASIDGGQRHTLPVGVHDLAFPKLDLYLTILRDVHYPGEDVVASFRAVDLKGAPVVGAQVEYRMTLGDQAIRDRASVTDAEGRALIRFRPPATAWQDGFLAAGVQTRKGTAAAIAKPIDVSAARSSTWCRTWKSPPTFWPRVTKRAPGVRHFFSCTRLEVTPATGSP